MARTKLASPHRRAKHQQNLVYSTSPTVGAGEGPTNSTSQSEPYCPSRIRSANQSLGNDTQHLDNPRHPLFSPTSSPNWWFGSGVRDRIDRFDNDGSRTDVAIYRWGQDAHECYYSRQWTAERKKAKFSIGSTMNTDDFGRNNNNNNTILSISLVSGARCHIKKSRKGRKRADIHHVYLTNGITLLNQWHGRAIHRVHASQRNAISFANEELNLYVIQFGYQHELADCWSKE